MAKRHLLIDILIIGASIIFAFILGESGIAREIVVAFDEFNYIGIFIAGLFFTSAFTTSIAIVALASFAQVEPFWLVGIIGGIGALIGDLVIFSFFRDRVVDDIEFLVRQRGLKKFKIILNSRLFRWITPVLGALIIASPFPDEVGIALLGLDKINKSLFICISLVMNTIGIMIMGLVGGLF